MDIYRAEKIAQDRMASSRGDEWDKSFLLVGNGKLVKCQWLDPYFGMFTIDGVEGFVMTKQIPSNFEVLMGDEGPADQEAS